MKETITKQPVLNIGLVGHIDHGKSTLLHQLSGKWTDTHSEELKRGITIKLGYADAIIRKCSDCPEPKSYTITDKCSCGNKAEPLKYVSFVDAPGHEMLMATMLSGAAIVDAAILVIAANEPCPKPQTREHLVALGVKGISKIIIVQNKVDLITQEEAKKSYVEIKGFVKGTVAENAPIIPCSAQQGVNIDAILRAIDKIDIPERDTKSPATFFVARSFDVNKPGTGIEKLSGGVLGGVLKQGILKVGEEIEIKPGLSVKKHNLIEYKTLKTKVMALYSGKNKIDEAIPSGSLAIQTELSPELTKADSLSGCVVGKVGEIPDIQNRIRVKVELFKEVLGTEKKQEAMPIKVQEMLLLSVNTGITVGTVTRMKDNEVELLLRIPVVALKGSKISLARNLQGHWRLIGHGEIIA